MSEISDDLVQQVIELAARQFKLQMFEKCLSLFTRAIDYATSLDQKTIEKLRIAYNLPQRPSYANYKVPIHHPKLVTLLDSRAATLEKLKKFTQALNDCDLIIKIEPYNPKGYLRSGKIHQLMNKDVTAFECYVTGIKKINEGFQKFKLMVNNDTFNLLKHHRSLLKTKILQKNEEETAKITKRPQLVPIPSITSTKRIKLQPILQDLITIFPFEISEKILLKLSLKDISSCLRVCKNWNKSIGKMSLYNDIRMNQMIGIKEIKSCFNMILNSKRNHQLKLINSFDLRSIRRQDEKQVLLYILRKSDVSISQLLNISFVDITMEQIVQIIQNSNNAKKILGNLKTLKLQCLYVPTYEETLLQFLPNLESLHLIPSSNTTNIPSISIPIEYQPPINPFKNLKNLYIVGNKKKKQLLPFSHLFQEIPLLPNLKNLTIVGCNFQYLNQNNGSFNFLINFQNLESLIFENNDDFDLRYFFKTHELLEFPNLIKFAMRDKKIEYKENLMLVDPFYLNRMFSSLKILDLTGSSITYRGLIKILKICGKNLRQLSIGFCSNILHPTEISGFNSIISQDIKFDYEEFIRLCPLLEVLYLNQSTDFGDHCLNLLIKSITKSKMFTKIKVIDLSFNSGISGYKLLELVKLRTLEVLILNGIDIQAETIKYMQNMKLVGRVISRLDKQTWKEYGVNSYDPLL